MISSLRKFSSSIYAKILFGIIIIPFVFWGMGSSFVGGNKNIVLSIDKEKYSTQDFVNFIRRFSSPNQKITADQIEEILTIYIGDKLIEKEADYFKIKLSDNSLGKLVKNQKDFKRDDEFSRIEYEKFLLEKNIPAVVFEASLSSQEKKKQLFDFIGNGITPSKFLVNLAYDKINQRRAIELINLNDIFKKQINFSEYEIKTYFEENIKKYTEIYKSVKLLDLTPNNLVDNNEFNDLFFKKIDEIDDLIVSGEKLDSIIEKFNLVKPNSLKVNKLGKDINLKNDKNISEGLAIKIFNIDEYETTTLIEDDNKYFIVELFETESIQKNINDDFVKKGILFNLNKETKKKLTFEIIAKINKNSYQKFDFDKLSREENVNISKIYLKNINDNEILKKEIVNQIYKFPEKKIIVVNDVNLSENYLIYIDKIDHVTINEKSEEYQKYLNFSKIKIVKDLYNTYDSYLNKTYKININHQAVNTVKNYYN